MYVRQVSLTLDVHNLVDIQNADYTYWNAYLFTHFKQCVNIKMTSYVTRVIDRKAN